MSWFVTTTGARIGQLLDAIDFNEASFRRGGITAAGARNTSLDTGDSIVAPNADGTKSALALIQEMLEAERGVAYVSGSGVFTYEERGSRARRTTSTATISSTAITSNPGFEFDQLVNRIAVTPQTQRDGAGTTPNTLVDGTTQVAQNEVSTKVYGVQDGSPIASQYVTSTTTALNLGQYIVRLRSSFVAPVTVELDAGDPATVTKQLSLELQDRVTITDANAGTSGDYVIEGIEVEIGNGGTSFRTTYTLSAYGDLPFVFGSSTQGTFAPPDGTVTYSTCVSSARPTDATYGAANAWIYETDTGKYRKNTGTLASPVWTQTVFPRLTY